MTKSVLIVEDEVALQRLASAVVTKAGYHPHVASNGDEALQFLNSNPVDLVLLDVTMPGKDGIETLSEMRKIVAHQDTPVFMLSGHTDEKLISRCKECGADDFLQKPVNPMDLIGKLKDLLGS